MKPNSNNHHSSFRQDERSKSMDPKRLERLEELANQLADTPANQKSQMFLKIMQTASGEGLSFTSDEQNLLFSILTETMSPEERRKADTIRKLALQMRKNQRN